jgi:hypothetical protein
MSQIVDNLEISFAFPSTVGGAGTTTKFFPNAPGPSIGVQSRNFGFLYCPGNGEANGQRMSVFATGNYGAGTGTFASPIVTLSLYPVLFDAKANGNSPVDVAANSSDITPGVGRVKILSTPIVSQQETNNQFLTGGVATWMLGFDLVGDSQSGLVRLISGFMSSNNGSFGTVNTGLVSALSNVNYSAPIPFGPVIGITFTVSDANASGSLWTFNLSM